MEWCKICDSKIDDEDTDILTIECLHSKTAICSACSEKIREQVWAELSNTVLMDGKAVDPGIYTCIWAGNQEWIVIQTKSDIIPDEKSSDMVAFMEVLALAIEGVLEQHEVEDV